MNTSYVNNLLTIADQKHLKILSSNINGHDKLDCICLIDNTKFSKYGYQIKGLEYPCPICSKRAKEIKSYNKRKNRFLLRLKEEKPTFILKGKFVSYSTPTDFLHTTCNRIIHNVTPINLLRTPYTDKGCNYCSKNHHWSDKEIKDWLYNNEPNYYFIYSKMIHNNNYVKLKHICGKETLVLWKSFFRDGVRCSRCNGGAVKSLNEFKDQVYQLEHGHYVVDSKSIYVNAKTPLEMIHVDCGKHYPVTPNGFLSGTRCPRCSQSHGERFIEKYLINKRLKYFSQYRFSDCKYKEPLPFDFYLPDLNMCIEYDGIQHYEVVELFGGIQGFKIRKKRDLIKNEYCNSYGIKLLRISYKYNTYDKVCSYLNDNLNA